MNQNDDSSPEYFDLTDDRTLIDLGNRLTRDWSEQLIPLIRKLPPERRILFFSGVFAALTGHVMAAANSEAAIEILKAMLLVAEGKVQPESGRMH